MTQPPPPADPAAGPPPVAPPPVPERPASPSLLPTITGYVLLAWSALGLVSIVVSTIAMLVKPEMRTQGPLWATISVFLGLVSIALLVGASIGLIRRQAWARKLGMAYVAFVVVFSFVTLIVSDHHATYAAALEPLNVPSDMLDMMAWVAAITSFCVGLLFPLALAIVLNVPAMKRALAEQPAAE